MSSPKETIIISLGGSMIVPDDINVSFLKDFKNLIEEEIKEGKRFLITTGGGKTSRRYQKALSELRETSSDDIDWIGIHANRFHAEFLLLIFGKIAHSKVLVDPTEHVTFLQPILVGSGGWKPGGSSDYFTVQAAETYNIKKIINLSNVNQVYNSDPKGNPSAKPLKKISWNDYLNIIPKEWKPGLNTPFDPTASKLAQKYGIEVAIMNGNNLENLKKYLKGEEFEGTVISQ